METIIAILIILGFIVAEIFLSKKESWKLGFIPMFVMLILVTSFWGYMLYKNYGMTSEQVRYEMDNGNYAEMTLIKNAKGKIIKFSDAKVYTADGIHVNTYGIDSDVEWDQVDMNQENQVAYYFIHKYHLTGYDAYLKDSGRQYFLGRWTLYGNFWIIISLNLLPLLMIYITVRLIRRYERLKEEQRRLKIQMEI